jgi:hypothetical protein
MRATCLLLCLVAIGADDPKAALKELLPPEERVPDRSIEIKPGLRLVLERGDTPACTNLAAVAHFMKAHQAGDRDALDRLRKDGHLVDLKQGTAILVVESHRPELRAAPLPSGVTGAQVGRDIQAAIFASAAEMQKVYPVEVRVQDGAAKGKAVFMLETFLVAMKTVPPPAGFDYKFPKRGAVTKLFHRPKVDPSDTTPGSRADALLAAGRKLEARGDYAGAIGAYWFTMLDFKELPQAVTAAERLKAMGFYGTGSGYEFDPAKRARTR